MPSRGQCKLQRARVVSQRNIIVPKKLFSGPEILEIVPESFFRAQTKRPSISPRHICYTNLSSFIYIYIIYIYICILNYIYTVYQREKCVKKKHDF